MPVSDRSVIDISGDGTDNVGGDVPKERDITIAAGVTIDGLVLPDPYGADVEGYYRSHVIGGKDAFIERASGYEDCARSVPSFYGKFPLPSPSFFRSSGQSLGSETRRNAFNEYRFALCLTC